ncbi:DUF1837 domain-containing protein [Streptococcus suis]|uniref:DUF1837 domain-containing protein n=1 Tax=Streptococcus suis TaxID=1307 RepID=UPI0037D2514E
MAGNLTEHHEFTPIQTHCFYIAFDIDDNGEIIQNEKDWMDEIFDEIANFALGKDKAVETSLDSPRKAHRDGLRYLYRVKEIKDTSKIYEQQSKDELDSKYFKRGEFGELILYHLLANKLGKPQLISKIYFKDSYNDVVHGFDGIHYDTCSKELWIGESKFYKDKNAALSELALDLRTHFNVDFFNEEFTIIQNRFNDLRITDEDIKDLIDPQNKFLSKLVKINACFFALFDSEILDDFSFEDGSDEPSAVFLNNLEAVVKQSRESFNQKIADYKNKDRLKIHLFLFPVKDKYELVKKMHNKLKIEQGSYNG